MPNSLFEDRRLSIEARGMLGYLLTKPPSWHVDINNISKVCCCGVEKVYRCIKELQEAGYARRLTPRDNQGRFERCDYLISDTPLPENPDAGETGRAEPGRDNQSAGVKKDSEQRLNRENTKGRGRAREPDERKATRRSAMAERMSEMEGGSDDER